MTHRSARRRIQITSALMSMCALFVSAVTHAKAPEALRAKLQWVDPSGEIVDIDWPNSVQWIWNETSTALDSSTRVTVTAQAWIEVPENLKVVPEDASSVRLLTGGASADEVGNRQLLIVDMKESKVTMPMRRIDSEGSEQKVGLIVGVEGAVNVLLHSSCQKEGISLRPVVENGRFLFVSVRCKRKKGTVTLQFSASEDAALNVALEGAASPEITLQPDSLKFSQKGWKALKPGNTLGSVQLTNRHSNSETAKFAVVYREAKPSGARSFIVPTSSKKVENNLKVQTAPDSAAQPQGLVRFSADLGFSHVGYTAFKKSGDANPAEQNLAVGLHAERRVRGFFSSVRGDVELPLARLMPLPFQRISSGFYGGGIAAVTSGTKRKVFSLRGEGGVEAGYLHLEKNRARSDFLYGPKLSAAIDGVLPSLQDRTLELKLGIAPLAGASSSTFFDGFHVSGLMAFEMIKGASERRWDLLILVDYMKISSSRSNTVDWARNQIGVRTWF